jgi:hypothetical protein
MKFITGTNRNQLPLFTFSKDEAISQDNEVRLVALFADSLQLSDFGLALDFVTNGKPADTSRIRFDIVNSFECKPYFITRNFSKISFTENQFRNRYNRLYFGYKVRKIISKECF